MLRPGQLVYSKCPLEGWATKSQALDMDSVTLSDKELFEPGEIVEITTWVVVPAWCPMVITGPTQVRGGKEYYRLLVPRDRVADARSHYYGRPATTDIVYVSAQDLDRNAIYDDARRRTVRC